MELTNEQIRRIHCLYYGCEAILNERADLMVNASMNTGLRDYVENNYSTEKRIRMVDLDVAMYRVSFIKLLLKPLSAITDEDAIEVCRMIVCPNNTYPANDYRVIKEEGVNSTCVRIDNDWWAAEVRIGVNHMIVWMPDSKNARIGAEVYDYLRSKGYGEQKLFDSGLAIAQ